MKPLATLLAALALAACALAAQAEPVTLSAGGTFTLAPFGADPTTATLAIRMDRQVAAPVAGLGSFAVHDLAVQLTHGSFTQTITDTRLGWFNYESTRYAGIDFRLYDVLDPGDMLQFIWTPGPLFSGPLTAPTLNLVSLRPIGGLACYYPIRSGACSRSTFDDGHYSVTPAEVPEPTTLALLPLALGLAAGATRRRKV